MVTDHIKTGTMIKHFRRILWRLAARLEPGYPEQTMAAWADNPQSNLRSALTRSLGLRAEASGITWPWLSPCDRFMHAMAQLTASTKGFAEDLKKAVEVIEEANRKLGLEIENMYRKDPGLEAAWRKAREADPTIGIFDVAAQREEEGVASYL